MNSHGATPWTAGQRGEVLLVDDSISSLAYLSSMLTLAGYLVREAPSGELALMTLRVRLPELVLLDVRMPEMDGFEVCRRIKASPVTQDIPVIFLSAQDETPDRVQGLQVGAVDFISKTFAQDEMLARMDTHITLARVKKALEAERAHLEERVRERTEALRQGQALLLTVIDSGPDWICATDREHRYLLANRNMANGLGYAQPEALIGRFDCQALPCDGCDQPGAPRCDWHEEEREVFAGKTVYHDRERITLPDGSVHYFETFKTPLRDAENAIYGMLCYRRDITQRLAMENEHRQLEQALWQAKKMQAVGQLAGGIAHDFNHLLSLILGYTQFAQAALAAGKTDKLDGYLAEVMKAASEGQAVVAQLLAFSRTDETASQAIDIAPLVAEVIEPLNQVAGGNIRLQLHLEPGLPAVLIKPVQLRQVVTNLVLNAYDALSGRTGQIDVRLTRQRLGQPGACVSCRKPFQGDYLVLSVSDNGQGIAPDIIDKVFDPFFTTKEVGKGVGLGLPMVHGIVHSVGGHIQLRAGAQAGAEFSLWIPLGEPRSASGSITFMPAPDGPPR